MKKRPAKHSKKKPVKSSRKFPGESDPNIFARVASREVRKAQEARERMLNSNKYTQHLDNALSAAESELFFLMRKFDPIHVALAFEDHVHRHLGAELSNVAKHGHRNDSSEDVPPTDAKAGRTNYSKS